MTLHRRFRGASLIGLALAAALVMAGCGSDSDDNATGDTTTTTAAAAAGNTLEMDMVDYGYVLKGELKAGVITIASKNSGKEMHMAGFGKLKAGKTAADLATALQKAPPPGEGEGGDPFAEFIEKEIDSPGHIMMPGGSQSLTVTNLEAGNYAVVCFIPTEGEGTPHFAKGMVNGFTVAAERSDAPEPEADITVELGDEAEPKGIPTSLKPGKHTLKLTATGKLGKDFGVAQLEPGKKVEDVDAFFEAEYEKEGGPDKGAVTRAPVTFLGFSFEIAAGTSVWLEIDIPAGDTTFVSTTNPEAEDADGIDKVVTVKVG